MRSNLPRGPILALAGGVAMWSCGTGGSPSPSGSTSPLTALTAPSTGVTPKADESPTPAPTPDPGSDPTALAINIIGSFGSNAFNPNPIQASIGNLIVWSNADMTTHHIVLDDGSDVGELAPGVTSTPMPLKSSAVLYYCTIHPSMVGIISDGSMPVPPPPPPPPPDDGGYYGYRLPRVR